ncbi:hypothetical protein HPSD74_0954 [Glaesserella parasuis D74]|nr:hypothetical protein HPSD74_0954 [Glaesserella parasuis D74]
MISLSRLRERVEQIRRICGGRGLCKYFTKSNRLRPLSAQNSLTLF